MTSPQNIPTPTAPSTASPNPPAPTKPPSTPVTAAKDSRLESLLARYDLAKAAKDQTEAELKEITDAIKHEARTMAPASSDMVLRSDFLTTPLRVHAVTSTRVNPQRFRERAQGDPVIAHLYASLTSQSTAWKVERVK